jgi:hypothetical protein
MKTITAYEQIFRCCKNIKENFPTTWVGIGDAREVVEECITDLLIALGFRDVVYVTDEILYELDKAEEKYATTT